METCNAPAQNKILYGDENWRALVHTTGRKRTMQAAGLKPSQ